MSQSEKNYLEVKDKITTNPIEQAGIIILGNSGVGKSFLANVLIGHEAFVHRFSANSVTHTTECVQAQIDGSSYTVFNVPGLIESEQERINLNKAEIDKAFEERPNSIIIFVFGHQNGRIRDEDIVAFNAINAAYSFRVESLAIVVNGLVPDRTHIYEGTALVLLQHLLKDLAILNSNICFLDQINVNDVTEMETLKEEFLKVVKKCKPMAHRKIKEIETRLDQLKHAQKEVRDNQTKFEVERKKFLEQINEKQNNIRETVYEQQNEKEFFQRAIEQQQENLAEQRRQTDKERQLFELQVRKMQMELNQARQAYEELRRNPASPPQEVRRARSVFVQLRETLTRLIFKGFARIIGIPFPVPDIPMV